MRPLLHCAAVLVLTAWGAAAQVVLPPRDPAAAGPVPAGTATITGTVTIAGTGGAARRVRISATATVAVAGGERRTSHGATTDDQGRFVLAGLPAGRYTLSASKPGHVTVSYGQRQPGAGRPGTAIQLSDGQRFEAHLQIPRGGVLTGTLLDELGEAPPGVQVRALRYAIQGGARTLQQAGTASTDDRGIYRIYGLQPGEYVVCAMPRPTMNAAGGFVEMRAELASAQQALSQLGPERARELEETLRMVEGQLAAQPPGDGGRTGYAPVCYPGTTVTASAMSIPLGPGQERSGVDFQLQLVPIGRVEGTIVPPAGVAAQGIQVTLTPAGAALPGAGTSSSRTSADGRFRFENVAPGQYTISARGSGVAPRPTGSPGGTPAVSGRPDAPRYWAVADVSVDGREVSDVILALRPALALTGQLAFDGAPAPQDLSRVRVSLSPVPVPGGPPQPAATATADAAGRFTIGNIVPGRYRLAASGAAGWTTSSAIVSGQDAADVPIDIAETLSGALVTLTSQQSEISGAITDGRGHPAPDYTLIAFPADSRYWIPGARRVQSVRPGTDGSFTFRNLPAGEYRIATVLDPEPGSWSDPEYLRELEAVSLRVTLRAGEKKVQNIRLAGSQ